MIYCLELLCKEFSEIMCKEFDMSMIGDLTFFLGLQIKEKKDGIFICQSKYVRDLLKKYNMDQCKSANMPMSATLSLDQDIIGKSCYEWCDLSAQIDVCIHVCLLGWNPMSVLMWVFKLIT